MFVCVTPNGDLDLTLRLSHQSSELQAERELDTELVAETAGGKGHNVARFLTGLGHETSALGFAGGWVGERIATLLKSAQVMADLTPIAGTSRFFVSVTTADGVRERSYRQAGPSTTSAEQEALLASIALHANGARAVLLGGSLPTRTPPDFYARAISVAAPTPVVVDCSGLALARALEARPWLVKVNLEELATIVPGLREEGLVYALEALAHRYGVSSWWVTLGPNGALAWEDGAVARGRLTNIEVKNTSGAGDAFLAGLLHAAALGGDIKCRLSWALALAAAICEQLAPLMPQPSRIDDLLSRVQIELTGDH
jgi:1-phosphofructokinase family hexose kinase